MANTEDARKRHAIQEVSMADFETLRASAMTTPQLDDAFAQVSHETPDVLPEVITTRKSSVSDLAAHS
ncbi:hypothetical protein HBH98_244120 [Parastagonospora nodorum]|nr:hypothetical protein HBH53_230430 [Parastagonospora nodorum]KAH3956355.1 hypothetical protein HBH51_243770 [Parastagonospora nodorum]KAH4215528.1 hypothetical protein HBI06_247820 [Parastagonospora nodorum]KAH4224213.1 hypothetical protein HBI05_241970 [Parastagonospora nodorum]KAH4334268.1 hypothetical protein HBH98_244120 [Parastagonospora nodorum]